MLGAACLAGLAVGVWDNKEQMRALRKAEASYIGTMSEQERTEKMQKWHRAVDRSLGWEKP